MIDRQCTKEFPKQFLQCAEQGNDSYPKYRCRKLASGGMTRAIHMRQDGKQIEQEVTNQWVVPYNPFLLRQFNCHINIEICSSINISKSSNTLRRQRIRWYSNCSVPSKGAIKIKKNNLRQWTKSLSSRMQDIQAAARQPGESSNTSLTNTSHLWLD